MSKRQIHERVFSKLRSVAPVEVEGAPASVEPRRPSTYMGQAGIELRGGLKSRIQELETQLARGEVVLKLDPKCIRASVLKSRDPRSLSDADAPFAELKEDIRRVGNRTPIEVRSIEDTPDFDYEIVSGHRRHAACLQLSEELADGFAVRALLVDAVNDPVELVKSMHRENDLRADPSPFEYGMLYSAAMRAGIFQSQAELAAAVQCNPATVTHHIQLVELPAEVLAAFGDARTITLRWVRDLSRALKERPDHVISVARDISSRETVMTAEQVKTELVREPKRRSPGLGSYERTIRLGDKKTVGATLKRDGRNLRLSVGATITSPALLRRMTERVEAVVREVLKEDEESRQG